LLDNFRNIRERHNFANVEVGRKPHEVVRERIVRNEKLSQQARKVSSSAFLRNVRKSKPGRLDRDVSITQPKVGNKLVELGEVSTPRTAGDFHQKALKTTTRQIQPVHIATVQSKKGKEKQGTAVRPEKSGKKEQSAGPGKNDHNGGPGDKPHGQRSHKEKEGHK